MPIRKLPDLLVNQIAAGEVIERPANVVKELVENAIDAGATQIDVAIENGGRDLIRVTDNGSGVPETELLLAVTPHATSKIEAAGDLDAIGTMGFRGEALASIASVSRLTFTSRPKDQEAACAIEAEGDALSEPRPAGGASGTTVAVRNLFYNTPARRKFLKTDQTEGTRCLDMLKSLALAHAHIGMSFSRDGKSVLELAGGQTLAARVFDVIGRELEADMTEFQTSDRGVAMWGLVGQPSTAKPSAKHLRVYLNGRPIMDKSITHAIREAYRGLIEPGRYPVVVLFLEMDPHSFDVNVHPTKAEVRFRDQGVVHSAVRRAVQAALAGDDLTPGFDLSRAQSNTPNVDFSKSVGANDNAGDPKAFVDYFRRLDPRQKGFVYSEVKQALAESAPEVLANETASMPTSGDPAAQPDAAVDDNALPTVRTAADVLQIHSSYIVTQDSDGLLIIDQHALHERVMFERLKADVTRGGMESQRLLMPEIITLDARAMEAFEQLDALFEQIGIEAAAMGPNSIGVQSFPSLLFDRGVEPGPFMTELLERAAGDDLPVEPEAALHETLDMMACKAAIKAGDRLTEPEIADLLRQREAVERSSNCPHGRPTTLRLTIRDLEKQFGRS